MNTQETLLLELEVKMDAVVLKYKNSFKESPLDGNDFLQKNYENIRTELAQLATDTIHQSIVGGTSRDQFFILSVQKLNVGSVYKLMSTLAK